MKIAFCAFGATPTMIERTEFYRQDLEILRSLGHEVEFIVRFGKLGKQFDVAFVWWWNYLWGWGPAARLAGVPVVTTGVFDLGRHVTLPFYKRALKKWGARFSDVNIFVSKDEFERVPRHVDLKPGSAVYSPLVIDTGVYRPGAIACPCTDPPTIANVCWQRRTNIDRKMIPELLEAFARFAKSNDKVRLILAGPPEDGREFLIGRAKELKVSDRVDFPGELSREAKIDLMRRATVYCQVSRYEGFGVAIAEAMACGTPVLVSKVGAVPEVVGDCGTYVNEISVEGIHEGLETCLKNPGPCRSKAEEGVLRIQQLFSVERRRSDLKAILEKVVAEKTG